MTVVPAPGVEPKGPGVEARMDASERETYSGIGVSPGIGVGPVKQMVRSLPELPEPADDIDTDRELDRAVSALTWVADDLDARAERAGGEAQEVLEAQAMMALDPSLRDRVATAVTAGSPAPHAVMSAFGGFRKKLEEAGGYLGERVADLDDVRNRIIARILGAPVPGLPTSDTPFVLSAVDLAPADTADLDPENVVALITREGGPTSHTAIIAKSLDLPAVVACAGALDIPEGGNVMVDGRTGTVTVDPQDTEVEAARERESSLARRAAAASGPGKTADGHAVALLINIGGFGDITEGLDFEGVGLFRTEFLFLDREQPPSVDEQRDAYAAVLERLPGKKATFRTLDAGADKPLPFLHAGAEENPALGVRGIRTRIAHKDVLTDQLQAIAAAAQETEAEVSVMAPMVATLDEAQEFVDLVHSHGLERAGVMVEVPALALQAEQLVRIVDFVSIGTNDLSQYTFAADRMVGALGELLDPWQPSLLALIAMTAQAGRQAGCPVGVCGEAASDPLLALVLTGLGVTSLSMVAGALPAVRGQLSAHTVDDLATLTKAATAATTAAAARAAVENLIAVS